MIEVFSAKTTVERRQEILERYNVTHVLIDARSELYRSDARSLFGNAAIDELSGPEEAWRLIRWDLIEKNDE